MGIDIDKNILALAKEHIKQNAKNKSSQAKKGLVVSVLHEISKSVVRNKDIPVLLKEVLNILSNQIDCSQATVTLRNGNLLKIYASKGLNSQERKRGVYRIGEGITGCVAENAKSIVVKDISKDNQFLNRTLSHSKESNSAFICVPILNRDNAIGTLSIDMISPSEYDLQRNLRLLETVANIIADTLSVLFLENKETEKLNSENRQLRNKIDLQHRPENAIGSTAVIIKTYELISKASECTAPILIRGEVGSGKDFTMRAIANSVNWKNMPLETLDCSTMKDSLIEAELFGSKNQKSLGLLHKADGGTVYLDAIGLIGKALQIKLLRYITTGEFSKVGSDIVEKSSARIIASTSGDLEERMKSGRIRADFYYQITTFTITIPPLRQRRRDIPSLSRFFLKRHAHLHEKKVSSINSSAMNMLCAYHWPSNVRELENCIERAVLISTEQSITQADLPPSLQTPQSTNTSKLKSDENVDFKTLVAEFEREIIIEALTSNSGNASATARQLAISRRILNYKIEQLDIDISTFKPFRKS